MNDQVLLIISIMTEKWFRKFLFIFNLTGVYNLTQETRFPISQQHSGMHDVIFTLSCMMFDILIFKWQFSLRF